MDETRFFRNSRQPNGPTCSCVHNSGHMARIPLVPMSYYHHNPLYSLFYVWEPILSEKKNA